MYSYHLILKIVLAGFLLIFHSSQTAAQIQKAKYIYVNPSVNTEIVGSDYNILINALNTFFKTKNKSYSYNALWDSADLRRWKYPYLDLYNQEISYRLNDSFHYRPSVLQVLKTEVKDQYIVKIGYFGQEQNKFSSFKFIYNLYAIKDKNRFLFKRNTGYYTRNWQRTKVSAVDFIVHPGRTINMEEARKTADFCDSLAQKFKIPVIPFTYYSCSDPRQVFETRGFEYIPNMYFDETGGLCEAYNRTIFSGQNNEWYPHEIVHLYTHQIAGDNLNNIADEGVATYLGGSGGLSLQEHIRVLKAYKTAHPEIDLAQALFREKEIGDHTSTKYTLSGLLSKLIDERHGPAGLKKWLSTDAGEAAVYVSLKNLLGIEKNMLNKFLTDQLIKTPE